MELFRLFGSILIDDKDAIEKLNQTDKKAKTTKGGLDKLIEGGAKVGAALVAGTGAAVGGMMALANNTADTADKWDKLSLRTGIGVENLQKWGYAASQSGADIGKLEVGMKKLSDTMIDAQKGSKVAKEAYEGLGITMQELSAMTPEEAFERTIYALSNMEESALKNSIGNDLLGKSYTELKPLIAAGADGIDELRNRASELGIVMSESAVKSGVVFGDTMADVKDSLGAAKDRIVADLMPNLTKMLQWVLDNMPKIQEVTKKAFDLIAGAIQWVGDNSNWLIPVLAGVAAAFVGLQIVGVITKLMTTYKAITTAVTSAQGILNAVMAANPIGLLIVAIAALIAIGVALYKNWDKIKEAAQMLWNKITTIFEGVKKTISNVWNSITSNISNAVDSVRNKITSVFSNIWEVISSPFQRGMEIIRGVIEKIKGFLNFKWEFPKIKMPHFRISNGSLNPLDWIKNGLPRLSVDWYADGGIFDKPTIFNTPYGLKGVGEAGPEVVAPLSKLKEMLGERSETTYNIYLNDMPASDTDKRKLAQYIEAERRRGLMAKGAMA